MLFMALSPVVQEIPAPPRRDSAKPLCWDVDGGSMLSGHHHTTPRFNELIIYLLPWAWLSFKKE